MSMRTSSSGKSSIAASASTPPHRRLSRVVMPLNTERSSVT